MKGILAAVRVCSCGLAGTLLAPHGLLSVVAQEPASAEALIERLRQVQGEIAAGQGQPSAAPSSRAGDLIRDIEAIEQQLRAGAAATGPAATGPALSEEEVRSLISDGLGVDVLKAETVERDGRQLYALTVMNPPGNYNGALMVRTLLVDGATGGLLGEVPHQPRADAPGLSAGAAAAGPESSGVEIRRRTYR